MSPCLEAKQNFVGESYCLCIIYAFRCSSQIVTRQHNEKISKHTFKPFQPDDEVQIDRIQIAHHLYRVIWDGNFSSPVKARLSKGGAKVLDIGCGPGTWICDMATDFPKSSFIGVDYVPTFPTEKPTNVQFIVGDILEGLDFGEEEFDFINMRQMALWFSEEQYKKQVIPELTRLLKVGGWLEISESEFQAHLIGPKFKEYLVSQMAKYNRNPDVLYELEACLGQFSNISRDKRKIPVGSNDKIIGQYCAMLCVPLMLEILSEHVLKLSHKKCEKMVKEVIDEANKYNSKSNCYDKGLLGMQDVEVPFTIEEYEVFQVVGNDNFP
ncbi:809_t:CDS:2, partial [Ambispora leptoticha]